MANSGDRQTLTADGQTNYVRVVGPIRLSLTGGFGGGTAKLQARDVSGADVDIAGASYGAAADAKIDFPANAVNQVRVDISGSTTPTLVVWVQDTGRGSAAL